MGTVGVKPLFWEQLSYVQGTERKSIWLEWNEQRVIRQGK